MDGPGEKGGRAREIEQTNAADTPKSGEEGRRESGRRGRRGGTAIPHLELAQRLVSGDEDAAGVGRDGPHQLPPLPLERGLPGLGRAGFSSASSLLLLLVALLLLLLLRFVLLVVVADPSELVCGAPHPPALGGPFPLPLLPLPLPFALAFAPPVAAAEIVEERHSERGVPRVELPQPLQRQADKGRQTGERKIADTARDRRAGTVIRGRESAKKRRGRTPCRRGANGERLRSGT